jgi:hypothetical protein
LYTKRSSVDLYIQTSGLVDNRVNFCVRPISNLEWKACCYVNAAMNFSAVTLGRKQYADARVVTKLENPVIRRGGAPFACGISKTLSHGLLLRLTITSSDFGLNRLAPTNS